MPMPALPRRFMAVVPQAIARGTARCASQVVHRGAQAVALGAATLPQQGKNNSAKLERTKVNITGFICIVVRWSLQNRTFV
jgi:hypothetical protein